MKDKNVAVARVININKVDYMSVFTRQ